jgi:hypothetical protein
VAANIIGIAGVYICLANWSDSIFLAGWVHTINSFLVFVDFWYVALYWNVLRFSFYGKLNNFLVA